MIHNKDITIDKELESLLPPLSDDENAELLKSIAKDGFNDPIIVWLNHGILVDGHNRHRIWRDEYNSDEDTAPAIVEKPFDNRDDVKEYMLRRQLARRNLTDAMRVKIALQLKPVIEAKAKAKQVRKPVDSVRLNSDEQTIRVDEEIAKAAGVGRDTVRKVEAVLGTDDESLKQDMLSGKTSVNAAHKAVTKTKGEESKPKTSETAAKQTTAKVPMISVDEFIEPLIQQIKEAMSLRSLRNKRELVYRLMAYSYRLSSLATEIEATIGGAE